MRSRNTTSCNGYDVVKFRMLYERSHHTQSVKFSLTEQCYTSREELIGIVEAIGTSLWLNVFWLPYKLSNVNTPYRLPDMPRNNNPAGQPHLDSTPLIPSVPS